MQIQKDSQGKWLDADYDKYLTQTSATEDKDRLLVKRVYVPLDTDLSEWNEIDKEEAERIKKAKEAAKGSVDYPDWCVCSFNQQDGIDRRTILAVQRLVPRMVYVYR